MSRFRHRFSLWFRRRRAGASAKSRRRASFMPVLRRRRSRGQGRGRPLLIAAVIALVIFIAGNYYIKNHLRPIMTRMAFIEVDHLAVRVINQAIIKRITDDNVTYGSLVYFEKDIYGQITALKTDIVAINRLKADITDEVVAALERADTSKLAIPVGNLINSDILSGRGPRIPLKIVPLGTVSSSFSNQFTDAGINQTRHQIIMDIEIDISILLPGYRVGAQVGTQVPIAETVIVGAVPDSYFQMDDIFRRQ